MNNIDLKQIRAEVGYTQKELASKLEITQQQYSRYETNTTKMTVQTLLKILEICNYEIKIEKKN